MTDNYDLRDINKKISAMILPVAIEGVLQMAAGLVMMGMIGRIDVIAVSALGISMRITQMVWALFKGITTGASVYVAQYFGAKEYGKMKHVMQQTLISTIIVVVILQAVVYIFSPALLGIFDPSPELLEKAITYIRTVSFGLPFLAVMLVVGGVLQGMGNAKTPMIITMMMNIVNIAIGYVLIFGRLGFEPMGVKGAAIATALSQFVAAILGLYVLFNQSGVLHSYLNTSFFSVDMPQIRNIYKVGLPSSAESMFWQLAAIILTRSILTYGETAFAAHQLGMQAESISYMPATGFSIAATAFIGQALGANDKNLAKIYLKQIFKGAISITAASVIVLVFFPGAMMSLLTDNPEVIRLGSIYLILMGIVQIPQNASNVLMGAMRGAGYTNIPMLVAGTGLWGIRVPFTLVVVYLLKLPITGIWVVMSIDLAFRFLFNLVLYKRKNIYDKALL
ncbi:MATE family efflux transporter [Lutispora saccharofermentans]|uniref:Probable multidrug resistance protein NorM n=1 Tax=Lutispora saccharofermentans TaxID=3024236 RepID=A0ABT1NKJ7_9FIRM|nr:MATE family efflux transporter [Lutispora saccharofermentans]MCQ1531785.1 MATE family efflux transporter [Lutispora saccharofermentans]